MFNKTILYSVVVVLGLAAFAKGQTGSLWNNKPAGYFRANGSIYSDRLASQVGDLVTISVSITTAVQKSLQTDTSKTSGVDDSITSVLYPYSQDTASTEMYMQKIPVVSGGVTNFVNVITNRPSITDGWQFPYRGTNGPVMNWGSNHTFAGGGKIQNSESFTTTIQARVTEVLPNGVLRVEAKRTMEASKEKGTMILTGLVRQEDLDSTNSVVSTRVADLQIKQEGTGPLSREQRKGWLTKLYEFISPF